MVGTTASVLRQAATELVVKTDQPRRFRIVVDLVPLAVITITSTPQKPRLVKAPVLTLLPL